MKNSFKEYRNYSDQEIEEVWTKSLFIFDTSFLLNLYGYKNQTSSEILNILEKIKDRIWIPYHIGIEFNKRRGVVISKEQEKIKEFKSFIEGVKGKIIGDLGNKNYLNKNYLIETDKFAKSISNVFDKFVEDIQTAKVEYKYDVDNDELRDKIENLFNNKIGISPENQIEVDNLSEICAKRYSKKIPPGYLDNNKSDTGESSYISEGIVYEKKYGDCIIWLQILDHIRTNDINDVIFITDDTKDDWWESIKKTGQKNKHGRVELKAEVSRLSTNTKFLMYNTENFLHGVEKFIKQQIGIETIDEVKSYTSSSNKTDKYISDKNYYKKLVCDWLKQAYQGSDIKSTFFPDFSTVYHGKKYGFEIMLAYEETAITDRIKTIINQALGIVSSSEYDILTIVIVPIDIVIDEKKRKKIYNLLKNKIHILVGRIDSNENIEIFNGIEEFGKN